jgi:hypothetical protein
MNIRRTIAAAVRLAMLLTLCLAATGRSWATEPTLEEQLLIQGRPIIEYLRGKGYHNVGVLKFRVKKGDDPISDNVGTLNMTAANKLEIALALANSNRESEQIGVVRQASAVAASIRGASHANADGRKKLFGGQYPLAWGDATVTPDAFLTGVILVSPDLRDMSVGILAFDASGGDLERVVPVFKAAVTADLLNELGEGFLLRGAFNAGSVQLAQAEAVKLAAEVKTTKTTHPLQDKSAPIGLEIQYDGRVVPIEIVDGEARVPEPREGQKVSFVLRHKGPATDRFAVVLKVNGENTLFRERLPDPQCRKWVLSSKKPAVAIRGFQSDEKEAAPFVVLSDRASKEQEVNYGADVGMLNLAVFREKAPDDESLPPSDDLDLAEDLAAVFRGAFPAKAPLNLAALKVQLRDNANRGPGTRGVIHDDGTKTANKVNSIPFEENPTPVMVAAIRYYKP